MNSAADKSCEFDELLSTTMKIHLVRIKATFPLCLSLSLSLVWLHSPGEGPQKPNSLKSVELEAGQVECITGNAHLCKLARLLHLLLSYQQSFFPGPKGGYKCPVMS